MWLHQGGGGGLSLRIWSSSRSQIRSGQFEGFSAGLNRCCVLWKRQNLQSRLNFIYPWQAQKWWGIKTEIKSNHDRVEALSLQRRSSQIGGKLNNFVRNWKIVSKYLKILQCKRNLTMKQLSIYFLFWTQLWGSFSNQRIINIWKYSCTKHTKWATPKIQLP